MFGGIVYVYISAAYSGVFAYNQYLSCCRLYNKHIHLGTSRPYSLWLIKETTFFEAKISAESADNP
jgi:hypothetical protein